MQATVFLIPTYLHPDAPETIPAYVLPAVQQCHAFFVENERTARRYLKKLWPQMVIDEYQWFTIHKAEAQVLHDFKQLLSQQKNIGIISEAGCPGIADPGQILIEAAQQTGATVAPLVGPNSIILALMASGMNGQHFQFHGYLPIDASARRQKIKELENEAANKNCTQIFIETPFRNNQMITEIVQTSKPTTRLCIAADLTAPQQYIKTNTITEWKKKQPDFHKRLCIFLLAANTV